jgi:hypothetical protein
MVVFSLLARLPHLEEYKRSFVGTLPIPLQRSHLYGSMLGFYAATPKVDGERAFVASDGYSLYELSRSLEERALFICSEHKFDVESASLFDAERVELNDGRRLYFIFDCLVFEGRAITRNCISTRVALVRHFCAKFEDADVKCDYTLFPRFLFRVRYASFAKQKFLVAQKPFAAGAYVPFAANLLKSEVKIDGWVFYKLRTEYAYTNAHVDACLKYKPPHLITLDFRVERVKHTPTHAKRVDLFWLQKFALPALKVSEAARQQMENVDWERFTRSTHGNYYLVIDVAASDIPALFPEGSAKVQHVLFARAYSTKAWRGIVECRFNSQRGEWEILKARDDKKMSNRLSTILDTLRIVVEPVTQKELFAELNRYEQRNMQLF